MPVLLSEQYKEDNHHEIQNIQQKTGVKQKDYCKFEK
jgi:hypothetical protein